MTRREGGAAAQGSRRAPRPRFFFLRSVEALSVKSEADPKHIVEQDPYWRLFSQLEVVFRAFPDIFFLLDNHGVILDYHASDPSLLHLPSGQFFGKAAKEILPKDLADLFVRAMERVVKSGEIGVLKYQLQTAQGRCWFDARLVPISEVQFIFVARDITEHELTMERARQQLRQLSALHSIDAALTASFDLEVSLSVILREILGQLHVDAADILLFNPHFHVLEFAAGQGFRNPSFRPPSVRIGRGIAGTAAWERRAVSASDLDDQDLGMTPSVDLAQEGFVGYHAVPLLAKGQIKGVMEVYHRQPLKPTEDWLEFLDTLANRAALAIDSSQLFQDLQKTGTELGLAHDLSIEGWLRALEVSGRESAEHVRRMTNMVVEIAQRLGMNDAVLAHLRRGAALHDIGMLGVPEAILFKPGQLSEEEQAIVREHPALAAQILQPLPYLIPALDIPRGHHERWDGSGYPAGLQGEQIPLAARIFAVVDVFDALTDSRPYRPAWTREEALDYVRQHSGRLFDPAVVSVFLKMMEG